MNSKYYQAFIEVLVPIKIIVCKLPLRKFLNNWLLNYMDPIQQLKWKIFFVVGGNNKLNKCHTFPN